ncbi:hypothetical protein AMTR_s00044p00190900 [Amborella trichopoda]|uniref:Uncharacterized protein n=1 Tax=Amborella trichopoda TaxID=13333 RepID=U5D4U2_AMBTC|nr:hypothetical protein AMTR_s00044p00190900 [Amborella trichopoda]
MNHPGDDGLVGDNALVERFFVDESGLWRMCIILGYELLEAVIYWGCWFVGIARPLELIAHR